MALGAGLVGGSTQFVVTALLSWTGDPLSPAYVLMAASVAGALAAFALPDGADRRD